MDLSSVAGPVAAILTALAGLPLGQAALKRREARLREGVQANLATVEKVRGLNFGNADVLLLKLERALEIQLDSLLNLEDTHSTQKKRNWPSLAAGFFLTVLVTTPMWFLWKPQYWYTWTIFVALGVLGALLLMSAFMALNSEPRSKKEKTK